MSEAVVMEIGGHQMYQNTTQVVAVVEFRDTCSGTMDHWSTIPPASLLTGYRWTGMCAQLLQEWLSSSANHSGCKVVQCNAVLYIVQCSILPLCKQGDYRVYFTSQRV